MYRRGKPSDILRRGGLLRNNVHVHCFIPEMDLPATLDVTDGYVPEEDDDVAPWGRLLPLGKGFSSIGTHVPYHQERYLCFYLRINLGLPYCLRVEVII